MSVRSRLAVSLTVWPALAAAPIMLAAIGFVWFYAPVEATMGIAQKIFYFHVPSAYSMYAATAVCAGASVVYLATGSDRADALAAAAGSVALLFAVVVLTTGPLWARAAWGVWWTWEPRLTAVLVLGLMLAAYAAVRRAAERSPGLARFAAALAVLGALDLPLIHVAVRKWRGHHPSVIGRGGSGLDPDMAVTLGVCLAAFTVLWIALLGLRYRVERAKRDLARLSASAALGEVAVAPVEGRCPA